MKLLMHTCCAPCSVYCIDTLRKEGIEPTLLWYNPNIHPYTEYVLRRDCLKEYSKKIGVNAIFEDEYGLEPFCKEVINDVKTRCIKYCYPIRLRHTFEYAKEHGKLITFDPNLRLPLWETTDAAKEQILWGLAHADVVKISDEEVEFLWGITDEKEAAEKLLDEFGICLAMVTMGPKGAYLANQNGAAYAKCPKVKPIDTTGAGDIFGGSAVSRLLKTGKAPEELSTEELGFIGQFACTAASISTTQSGGIPSIPEEGAVLARM